MNLFEGLMTMLGVGGAIVAAVILIFLWMDTLPPADKTRLFDEKSRKESQWIAIYCLVAAIVGSIGLFWRQLLRLLDQIGAAATMITRG